MCNVPATIIRNTCYESPFSALQQQRYIKTRLLTSSYANLNWNELKFDMPSTDHTCNENVGEWGQFGWPFARLSINFDRSVPMKRSLHISAQTANRSFAELRTLLRFATISAETPAQPAPVIDFYFWLRARFYSGNTCVYCSLEFDCAISSIATAAVPFLSLSPLFLFSSTVICRSTG